MVSRDPCNGGLFCLSLDLGATERVVDFARGGAEEALPDCRALDEYLGVRLCDLSRIVSWGWRASGQVLLV